jgi:large subunit ribosomal protein L35
MTSGSWPPLKVQGSTVTHEEGEMPKMKTNRGAAKRFSRTGRGKIRRQKAYFSHILTSKSRKRKRHLRKRALISKADAREIRRLIPYG